MRRAAAHVPMLAALVVLALAACSGSGSISLPTARPSINLPTVGLPTPTLPTLPSLTVPTVTLPTVPDNSTPAQTQTVTATASPSQGASPSPGAEPTTPTVDDGRTWWPWILVGLVVLGTLAWVLVRRRRAEVEVRAWDERLAAAEQEASWVEDSLTAQVLSRPSTAEAQSIWTAAQPRLLQIDESFHRLAGDAPDERRGERATDVRGLLRGLVEAGGADLVTGPGAGPDQFRARRAVIDSARRELRATLGPVDAAGRAGEPRPGG